MNIAIVGGGITGLTAAYELTKHGHTVTVFEKESYLGGLAYGFKQPNWDWHIEGAYHHLFTNDHQIISLLHELGLSDKLIIKRPITASLWSGEARSRSARHDRMYQLDSPMSLMRFPGFAIIDKLRTAILLAVLKITPFWRPLEEITAEHLLTSIGGKNAYRTIWEPLLYGKFGDYAPQVAASWFWARIQKRTPRLCYIRGGFHTFITTLEKAITDGGGNILTNSTITNIPKGFDKILLTIPTPIAKKLFSKLIVPEIPHLFAQTLILETDTPILKDVYWLNVTDRSFPFLAAVAHTNFMDKQHYGGHHLTYFGNYLPQGHPYLSLTKQELLKKFLPYIKKLSTFDFRLLDSYMFTAPFAQPVHQLHYSQKIPPIATPLPGIYLANMDYIVPWDRGTNYAVELGQQAAYELSSRA